MHFSVGFICFKAVTHRTMKLHYRYKCMYQIGTDIGNEDIILGVQVVTIRNFKIRNFKMGNN